MKKLLIAFVLAAILMSCNTTGDSSSFSSVTGKDWRLIEVRIESNFRREVIFDRNQLSKENARDVFILKFDNANVGGTAAPNRYAAPYSLGEGQSISVNPMRTTQMAALWQPERLREHDYFAYMQNIYRWEIVSGRLVLYSKTEDGKEIRMMFSN